MIDWKATLYGLGLFASTAAVGIVIQDPPGWVHWAMGVVYGCCLHGWVTSPLD